MNREMKNLQHGKGLLFALELQFQNFLLQHNRSRQLAVYSRANYTKIQTVGRASTLIQLRERRLILPDLLE